jgi:hypothetical protein
VPENVLITHLHASDGLVQVHEGSPNYRRQSVVAEHFLAQDLVHALVIAHGVLVLSLLDVEGWRQVLEDFSDHCANETVIASAASGGGTTAQKQCEHNVLGLREIFGDVSIVMEAKGLWLYTSPIAP